MQTDDRQPVRYFVSFSRRDGRLKDDFLGRLADLFGSAKKYRFVEWQDKHIEAGSSWHEQIQSAISESDFGLLLVSPAFLANEYIGIHELPRFLSPDPSRSEEERLIIPVALKALRFDGTMDLKGLEERQIFRDQDRKAYGQLTSPHKKDEFASTLFGKIVRAISNRLLTNQPIARKLELDNLRRLPARQRRSDAASWTAQKIR